VELLPSEGPVQTLKSEDLKTEDAIEEQSMDRKDPKVCSNSISNQTAHMQTNQVSSTTPQPVSTVSELAMKGQCENCLILAKVRDELQIQIAVLQNRIRAIICTKVSQHSVYSPHCDLDYGKNNLQCKCILIMITWLLLLGDYSLNLRKRVWLIFITFN